MSALKKILFFLFIFIFIFSLFFSLRFFLFNKDLKKDFGYGSSFVKKDTFLSLNKEEGERIVFTAPVEKISELKLDLLGESLEIIRDNSLKEVKIEVYYPESSFGEVFSKIDYKFFTNGDALIFATDKKTWKKKKSDQESLLVGFISVSLPNSIPSLSISNLFGETRVKGNYPLLNFISFEAPLFFEGTSQRMILESFKGELSLKGIFDNLTIRTFYSQVKGEGFIEKMNFISLSSSIEWSGLLMDFSLASLFLDMNLDLEKVQMGKWNIFSLIGESKVYLPKGSEKKSSYNFFMRKDSVNSLLNIDINSLGMSLNYFY